jgi:hypothetical protein
MVKGDQHASFVNDLIVGLGPVGQMLRSQVSQWASRPNSFLSEIIHSGKPIQDPEARLVIARAADAPIAINIYELNKIHIQN